MEIGNCNLVYMEAPARINGLYEAYFNGTKIGEVHLVAYFPRVRASIWYVKSKHNDYGYAGSIHGDNVEQILDTARKDFMRGILNQEFTQILNPE